MALDTAISLTTVAEVLAFLGEDARRDALWIYFDGTAGTATVEVQENNLVLIDPDNTSTTIDMTVSTTLTTLRTAILAVTGWKCGLTYIGSALSVDLLVTGALDAEGDENEQVLTIQDKYLIERLIDRGSDLINRYCERLLKTTSYTREIYYGAGFNKLLLEQYPVTRVTRLSAGRANSFSIKNTSTDANFCTVEITATAIRLVVDGGTHEHDTEATLVLADYSIDELIAAINVLAKGWSCTTMATDTATRDASELLIRPSMSVDATKQAHCETVDDDITDYKLLNPTEARNEGIIEKSGVFMSGREYFISFQAGYTAIPYILEQFCIYLVCYVYGKSKRAADGGLKSESFGEGADYKYEKISMSDFEKARAMMPIEIQNGLDLFKKRSF